MTQLKSEFNMSKVSDTGCEITCSLCGSNGSVMYKKIQDSLYHVPGQWGLNRCNNKSCGLVWLTPIPLADDIPGFYKTYYTHNMDEKRSHRNKDEGLKDLFVPWKRSALGMMFDYPELTGSQRLTVIARILGVSRSRKERLGHRIMWLNGNGMLLRIMNQLGWQGVGFEPDKNAARVGRNAYDLTIYENSIKEIAELEDRFNVITMSHVIEHLLDPVVTLRECARLLEKDGRVVIVTPNFDSLGRLIFQESWRGLEPPRHIHIFTKESLAKCLRLSGFEVEHIWASTYSAKSMYRRSRVIQRTGTLGRNDTKNPAKYAKRGSRLFSLVERIGNYFKPLGEEVIIIARKPG